MTGEQQRAVALMRQAYGLSSEVLFAPVNEAFLDKEVNNVTPKLGDNGLVSIVVKAEAHRAEVAA